MLSRRSFVRSLCASVPVFSLEQMLDGTLFQTSQVAQTTANNEPQIR
jgi:hypothetical protein